MARCSAKHVQNTMSAHCSAALRWLHLTVSSSASHFGGSSARTSLTSDNQQWLPSWMPVGWI